ncbi:hypothetical protein DFH28DRAFT_1085677 [Melampsora americana]|nr:hypothetical protein DFH28DRAFT_1085677 [Melampsora americana]
MKGYSRLFLLSAYGWKWVHAGANATVVSFGHPFSIAGENTRSEVEVSQELTIDAYSATAHKIIVTRNHPSATADYVTTSDSSSTGLSGSWVALNKYSYRVQVDDGQSESDDMIVNLEAKYDPDQLQSNEIVVSNVYLGRYNATRAGWVIDTERANVQINENHARIMGLNSADGEYMLLGRVTDESQNVFIQFPSASAGNLLFKSEFGLTDFVY